MNQVLIIAEAGVNHNGDLDIAKKMIEAACEAGADAVKFQTFKAELLVCKAAPKAQYQLKTTDQNESQFEMIRNLELDIDTHKSLIGYCQRQGIVFMSSPFDLESVALLDQLGLDIFKIPSGEIINLPYLRKIGKLNKKVILSTGMAELREVEQAMDILTRSGTRLENITVLHANTEYPTPMEDVNLNAMVTMRETLGVEVGYSDHTLGIEVAVAAVALGACVIEKHLTLDRTMPGPDHKASLEPREFKSMVGAIRNIEAALGDGVKKPSPSELKNKPVARKSLVAVRDIGPGEVFSEENIIAKRPGTGISPMRWDEVLRLKAKRHFKKDELIEL